MCIRGYTTTCLKEYVRKDKKGIENMEEIALLPFIVIFYSIYAIIRAIAIMLIVATIAITVMLIIVLIDTVRKRKKDRYEQVKGQ